MSNPTSSLYREVLRQAWQLSRRHKILWAFGLFAAFLGTGGALEAWAHNLNLVFSPSPWSRFCPWSMQFHFDLVAGLWTAVLALLLLGLAIFLIFIIINSFSSLILMADRFRSNKKIEIKKIWLTAIKKFWPVLGAVAFFKFFIFVFGALSVLPLWLILINQAGLFLLIIYPLLFLTCFLAILISSFLMIYTANFILLENENWTLALGQAWKIFIRHWLVNLEMAVIIFLINLMGGVILIIGCALLAVPVVLVYFFSLFINLLPLGAVAIFLGLLFATFLILWLAAFLSAFQLSAWTLLFRRMHQGTAFSKLIRIFNGIFGK